MSHYYVTKISFASSFKLLFIKTVISMICITNSPSSNVVIEGFLQYYM